MLHHAKLRYWPHVSQAENCPKYWCLNLNKAPAFSFLFFFFIVNKFDIHINNGFQANVSQSKIFFGKATPSLYHRVCVYVYI